MAKPEGWRLDAASYPVCESFQTRFQDMDVNGHLNNVAFAALFESGRVLLNWRLRAQGERAANERMMVAAVEINYLAEGNFPDPVEIATGIGRIGTSSWTLIQAMFQNGRAIATCDTVVVCRTDGEAKPLRAETVAELEANLARAA
ncbi:acyl-CoA thioesterase [Sphingopyxis granuli]|uniref:acyl-CoA thioesterase n=1 Tax=Sphingopyxis granuli TaxID=267128 RepID=UPI001F52F70F|nr:acyl-CoA thioesterase [Sphingopyxis granuli]UNK79371.1 acyl-CoA thioesterase [Sphingopyxis granuli]